MLRAANRDGLGARVDGRHGQGVGRVPGEDCKRFSRCERWCANRDDLDALLCPNLAGLDVAPTTAKFGVAKKALAVASVDILRKRDTLTLRTGRCRRTKTEQVVQTSGQRGT